MLMWPLASLGVMRHAPLRPFPVVVLLASLASVSGCVAPTDAGDGHGHGTGADHHGAEAGAGNLAVSGDESHRFDVVGGLPEEYGFSPDAFEVASGARVAVHFRNEGGLPHEFTIQDIGFHLHLEPGERASAAFIAPGPGEYVFGCYIPGHFEAGMRGTLSVTA